METNDANEEHLEESEDSLRDKYLTFNLGKEIFAIEIKYVTEIIGKQEITPVPDMTEYMCGVINLRGKVIPIMDVRTRFKMPYRDYDDRTCFVVLDVEETTVGIVVDRVSEVLELNESIIDKKNNTVKDHAVISGIARVESGVIIVVDCTCLISDIDISQMRIEKPEKLETTKDA